MLGGIYENTGKYGAKYIVKFPPNIFRRFESKKEAERFLNLLRYKKDIGEFDPREFKEQNIFLFENLALRFISLKRDIIKPSSLKKIEQNMNKAICYFQGMDVRKIEYAHIEDFLFNLKKTNGEPISSKTRANLKSTLHDFFTWLNKSKYIKELPEFPTFKVTMKKRKVIRKELQEQVLDEIYKRSFHLDPKIWFACKLLCTYPAIRPTELINLKEKHVDLQRRVLIFPNPKEGRPKEVPLLDEDVEIFKQFPKGLPNLFFFRHPNRKGCKAGQRYDEEFLHRKWWKPTCKELGIEGIGLYAGSKHSTVTDLRKQGLSPETIKKATMHTTSKAFDRYLITDTDDLLETYRKAKPKTKLIPTK